MKQLFTKEAIQEIATVIGCDKITFHTDHYRLKIINADEKREMVLEVFPETSLGKDRGTLIVIYTGNSHIQLHNCTGFVISEELGEVTMIAESEGKLSGLVVERGASCSLYAGIDRDLISSDFTQLGVEVMLSGVALSLAEEILADKESDSDK